VKSGSGCYLYNLWTIAKGIKCFMKLNESVTRWITFSLIFFTVMFVVITTIINGTGLFPVVDSQGKPIPGKTLWDWLQLIIVPLAIAIIAFQLNKAEKERSQELELDKVLQNYFDNIEKLISLGLKSSNDKSDLRELARSRTLATFKILDGKRKGILIKFLYELGLISKGKGFQDTSNPIINLRGADLRGCDISSDKSWSVNETALGIRRFRNMELSDIDLADTDLRSANFSNATLIGSNLSGVNLDDANISGANFSEGTLYGANLRNTNATSAYFGNSKLRLCAFNNANLSDSNFMLAELYDIHIDYLDPISKSPLFDLTDFSGANLSQTNFAGTKVVPDQLRKAKSLKGCLLPNECKYDGKYSLFSQNYYAIENPEFETAPNYLPQYLYRVEAYCKCGMKLENVFGDDSAYGFWHGLIKHRIRHHHHRIICYDVVGGREYNKNWMKE
jgi:uncharacterized protein YjbI with pentapeptide repeats